MQKTEILDYSIDQSGQPDLPGQANLPVGLLEPELARRWRLAQTTLQRWRREGTGPKFLRLSKKIVYPWSEILAYEKAQLHVSTSKNANDKKLYE